MALLFRDERNNVENRRRNNLVFLAYAFTPPLPKEDYSAAMKDIEKELPIRMWYFSDEITTNEMMRKIWRAILRSDLAIFDVTGGNPNVSLELGLSLSAEKTCLTILKERGDNPLGRADLGYAERVEYTSATDLKSKLKNVLTKHTSCGRLIEQVSDALYHDYQITKDQMISNIAKVLHRVFERKFVKMADVERLLGGREMAQRVIYTLRDNNVMQVQGKRRAAKWQFTDDYVNKDYMVGN